MNQFSRRRLPTRAATVTAAARPPSLRTVRADPAPRPIDSPQAVEHVIFLIEENHSFDNYFGILSGVRGFDDPQAVTLSTGKPVFYPPDPLNPDGYESGPSASTAPAFAPGFRTT